MRKTRFFSPQKTLIEDYRRNKRRRLIDRGREERMRAILERDGKDDAGDESDIWGRLPMIIQPDEAQKELLCRAAAHIVSLLNPPYAVGDAYPGEPPCGQAICILEGLLVASMGHC